MTLDERLDALADELTEAFGSVDASSFIGRMPN